ncbi:DUF1003 domain-containing protein, partial [Subtercola sp. RTI3]|uniref:DUF1003 domain-containing protein n=1 Tax=Subtercola sp. RTI3 TaxID=3048639 RepID=UPI002B226B8D
MSAPVHPPRPASAPAPATAPPAAPAMAPAPTRSPLPLGHATVPRRILRDGQPHHPLVLAEARRRAGSVQLRVADGITSFAGSIRFVYLHAALFALWMLVFEQSPWPTLTLVVSLEAIFLSTFVMIAQNRQAAFQQAKADHDFAKSDQELTSIADLTRQVHQLTTEIHQHLSLIHI